LLGDEKLSEIERSSWLKIPELEKTAARVLANFNQMEPKRFMIYVDYLSDKGWTVKELNEALEYLITEKNFPDFTINDLLAYRKKLYSHYSDIQYLIKNKGRCELDFVKVKYNNKFYFWDLKNGEVPPMLEIVKLDEFVVYYDNEGSVCRWNITKDGKCPHKNTVQDVFDSMSTSEKEEYFNVKFISFKEFKKEHPTLAKNLDPLLGETPNRQVDLTQQETPESVLLRKLRLVGLHPKEISDSLNLKYKQYQIGKKIFVDVNNRDNKKVNELIQEVLNDFHKVL
jgi:hypothetical protein